MSLRVISAGLCAVQDLGRFGHEAAGVAPGGAADTWAAELGNALVGNPAHSALLEIQLSAARFLFERAATLSITGAELSATLSGKLVELGCPVSAQAGETLCIERFIRGQVAYLAIDGGIEVPAVLGSRSTDLQAGFGGFAGRWLRAGDRLGLGEATAIARPGSWWCELPLPRSHTVLRYLPGPLRVESLNGSRWRVGRDANRMGLRLEGTRIAASFPQQRSAGVVPGAIQLPPNGQPIVLSTDAQTLGGYPLIGCVISADLRFLAQLNPGSSVSFEASGLIEARALAKRQRAQFNALLYAIGDQR